MLECNRLRIELGDGSPPVDYRIEYGRVERRIVECEPEAHQLDEPWQPLSAEQLSSHVMKDTVVARWLRRRMGIHRLIQACNRGYSFVPSEVRERSDRSAA